MCSRATPLSATLHACPELAWELSRKEASVADNHPNMLACEDPMLAYLVRVLPVLHKVVRSSLYGPGITPLRAPCRSPVHVISIVHLQAPCQLLVLKATLRPEAEIDGVHA